MRRLFLAGLVIGFAAPALAGPPYVTDDPEPTDLGHWEIYAFTAAEPTDLGHWEIYAFTAAEGAQGSWNGAGGVDLNYGAVKDVQLTATLPINATHAPGADTQAGPGNVELGIKYRFLHDVAGFDAAIFPRVILPSGGHQFGTVRTSVLLPLWIERDIGHWAIFGGGGYTINPGAGNRDFWNGGLTVTREVSERLAIGGEVTVEGADSVGGHSTEGADLGGVYHLGGPFSLLVSGGPVHEHHGPTGWRGYAALGLTF